jgi:ubiquinone/menaquinone biosynthesis C-methylase UbiE
MNSTNKKYYTSDLIHNPILQSYGFNIMDSYSSYIKLRTVLRYVNKEDMVLDAGCANGLFSFAISPYCKEIQGIDISEKFLSIADNKKIEIGVKNVSFSFGDLENIPRRAGEFDLVFSYSCLVLVEDMPKAIKECIRVTKKNGYVIFDITGKYNLSQLFWRRYYQRNGHFSFNPVSYSQIKHLCELNNLKIIEVHALGFLDQWKYFPVVSRFSNKFLFLDKIFHFTKKFDLDYWVSNLSFIRPFANRWYIVCQKI